jgi:hypothetical protein
VAFRLIRRFRSKAGLRKTIPFVGRPEQIHEVYYAYSVNKWATLTFDFQFVDNPGYNADLGPVSIFSARLHTQF